MKREVEIDRFVVKSDCGNLYTVVEFQQYISVATLKNPNGESPSLKRWETTTGFKVNKIDSVTFEIIGTNETIRTHTAVWRV